MLRNAIDRAPSWLGRVGQGVFVALILFPFFLTTAHAASLTLSWTDASTNEDGFHVQRKTGTTGSYATLATLASGTTGYVDGTVTAGTTYCYHVSAYNSAGDSAFSNEACAAPASATMYNVAVTKAGTGSGTVASSPAAINCGSTCSASIANGTSLALSATPAAGSTFTGWSGAYTGTGGCALVVDGNKSLTATFALSAPTNSTLTVTKAGTGAGTITSFPTGINCGSTCSGSFNSGATVTLTAVATTGSTFTGWSGTCSGTGTCAVTMSAARSVTATFAASTPVTLTSLTANKTSPQLAGTAITFTAAATGGAPPYEYRWWVYTGTTWTLARDWATGNTFTWTPTAAGAAYRIAVHGRSSGGTWSATGGELLTPFTVTAASGTLFTLTGLTADKASPQPAGTAITFTATAGGGTTPYQYRWWVYTGTTWTLARDWATGNTFTWTPTAAGAAYRIAVHGRSSGGTWSATGGELLTPFTVTAPSGTLALTSLTANPAGALRVGAAVTFTATASGGTAPYQYKWWGFTGGTWVVIRDWNTSNTFSGTATTAGTFQVRVWVRNSGTTADSPDASGVLSITVTP